MSFIRYIDKLRHIDSLIRKKATGNQESLSQKVGLSRSSLNEYLKVMKQLGFPICYCKHRNSYYYDKKGQMVSSLFDCEIDKDESKKIHGGFCFFRSSQNASFVELEIPVNLVM